MKNKNGITLIALVITIIVLLVLAGVSLSLVLGDNGVLKQAKNGVEKHSEAEVIEQIKLAYSAYEMAKAGGITESAKEYIENKLEETLNDSTLTVSISEETGEIIVTIDVRGKKNVYSYNPNSGEYAKVAKWIDNGDGTWTHSITGDKIQVGDIVHYESELIKTENAVDTTKLNKLKSDLSTYSGDSSSSDNSSINRENLIWKVLDIKDGKIRLISSTSTSSKIKLYGENGYNNAVYLLDEACDVLYSSNVGKSQNLKIEDVEIHLKYNYKEYISEHNFGFGQKEEYKKYMKYPNIYALEVGCKAISLSDNMGLLEVDEQDCLINGKSNASGRLKATQTAWSKKCIEEDFKVREYFQIFLSEVPYFLSSRSVYLQKDGCTFSINCIINESITKWWMFDSWRFL